MSSGGLTDDSTRFLHLGRFSAHSFTCRDRYKVRHSFITFLIVIFALFAAANVSYGAGLAPWGYPGMGAEPSGIYDSAQALCDDDSIRSGHPAGYYSATSMTSSGPNSTQFSAEGKIFAIAWPASPQSYKCFHASDGGVGLSGFSYSQYCIGGGQLSGTAPNAVCATCPPGYSDVAGVCQKPNTCPPAGTNKSSGFFNLGTDPDAPIPRMACDGGCATSYTGDGVTKRAMINGVYNYFFGSGDYTYTGATCPSGSVSPTNTNVPPNTCNPLTQSTGQVNGVTVCLPKTNITTNTTTTPPATTDPTTGNVTSTTTSQTDGGDGSNTTTMTTSTAPDGTVTKTTTNKNTPPSTSNFCTANPTDPSCNKPTDACLKNPDLVSCHNLGTAPPADSVPTSTKNITFAPVPISGSASCPASQTISVAGHSITIPYTSLCNYATTFHPLVIALSYLSALLIVASAFRD